MSSEKLSNLDTNNKFSAEEIPNLKKIFKYFTNNFK